MGPWTCQERVLRLTPFYRRPTIPWVVQITVESPDSYWAILTAISTAAAALATMAAIVTALVIATRDQRAAHANLLTQLDSGRRQAALDHEVGLLLQLQEQIAKLQGAAYVDAQAVRARIRGLIYALPDASELPAVRLEYLNEPSGPLAMKDLEAVYLIKKRMSDRAAGSGGDRPTSEADMALTVIYVVAFAFEAAGIVLLLLELHDAQPRLSAFRFRPRPAVVLPAVIEVDVAVAHSTR
jgi:hypothetical protein